jgi:DNA-binding LacI/PurR family transcriptional regulator
MEMATRREIDERKTRMLSELRSVCAERSSAGGTLPPLRDLATRYEVSLAIAQAVMKTLQDEGIVVSVQGAGTSIVPRKFSEDEVFLFLQSPGSQPHDEDVFIGMTDRFAELGAFTVFVPGREALAHIARDAVLRCRGLYGKLYDSVNAKRLHPLLPFPTVGFGVHADPEVDDCVQWDDHNGGREATFHLIKLGHRRITFVGAMGSPDHWSQRRAQGYREAMAEAGWGHYTQVLEWKEIEPGELGDDARRAGERIASGTLPDAIVACNDLVAVEVLQTLLDIGVPLATWPAIVGFDATGIFHNQPISSMRRDGREIGRVAADILWGRSHGEIVGGPINRLLPLRLVPRMTSQKGWAYRLHRLIGVFPNGINSSTTPTEVEQLPVLQ